ncbi:hypothetical protein DL96DRAFT_1619541 [Flagelloscypha sp. PMI_526]|nr:hypothetical protein DL96DRAFT_1619541 [Flagelloscypha sp. PMI_526]
MVSSASPVPNNMCYKVECKTCKKATWAGCGRHIEQALAGVAEEDRCQGHKKEGEDTNDEGSSCTTF